MVGTKVSVEDEGRDQDRDRGGGRPAERAALGEVTRAERAVPSMAWRPCVPGNMPAFEPSPEIRS
ncbi:hypothetical protein [Amycolatopsis australiensis]|uniref:hypothetical protein n=1 Tax=Amycolatopsis australiensis TaxID=546364 RepID=UPI001FE31031|nr:hypothetical protein [Amycolatopsis australiensis]